jgi:hypothetical protein
MRKVLAIPIEEVREYFARNTRQDVKMVAPELLAGELAAKLRAAGKLLKPEQPLAGAEWRHSAGDAPNALCESRDFAPGLPLEAAGPYALSFANEKSPQDAHYHPHHLEIYFSEHPLAADYRPEPGARVERLELQAGGALVFAAGVAHRARLGGLTVVIEIPAVKDDKVIADLEGAPGRISS